MKKKYLAGTLSALLTFSVVSFAQSETTTPIELAAQTKMAQNHIEQTLKQHEKHQRKIAWQQAPIKTKADLQTFAKKQSPLDLLSPAAKQRFIDHLVFSKNGLGGMYIGDLELELTPSQIHQLLSLFGAQHLTKTFTEARIETELDELLLTPITMNKVPDYRGYECIKRGTCKRSTDDLICMNSC